MISNFSKKMVGPEGLEPSTNRRRVELSLPNPNGILLQIVQIADRGLGLQKHCGLVNCRILISILSGLLDREILCPEIFDMVTFHRQHPYTT
jgi:hypothetical protein